MRIALLAHNLRVAGGLSVGRNLLSVLPTVAPQHEYLMVVPAGVGYDRFEGCANIAVAEIDPMPFGRRMRFDLFELPSLVREFKPDLVWALGNMGLQNPPCRQAILIQDSHLVYPSKHYRLETAGYRFSKWLVKQQLRRSLASTDMVFCQTETVKRRFATAFGYDASAVRVLPNAVSQFTTTPSDVQVPETLNPFGDRFKLFVLTKYYAHKNLEAILATYRDYLQDLGDTLCVFTIEASQHPRAVPLLRRIRKWGLTGVIHNVGPLRQDELAAYFLHCDALLMPTLLESFSGTYLEAMHFGVPILTSDLDFAHDVCGDAAEYFDPWNPASMKDAIIRVRDDVSLREDLVLKGQRRLKQAFRSWPEIARHALDDLSIPHGEWTDEM